MQNDLKNQNDYTFEFSQEVQAKMQQAGDLHKLISDERVKDLKAVNISNKKYRWVKRFLDALLSFAGLAVLLIPMALVALIVYVDDPGPVLFSQYRVGRNGKRFKLYKFRTMRLNTPKYMATNEVDDPDQYITRVGHVLRKLSLDEIPQLINVLKGDMSLVGPRPLISDEYEIHAMRMRFGVYQLRPGVTGLAQINGRDLIAAEEKVRWDVTYLRHFGPVMDLKILLATIPKVLFGSGIVEGYNAEEKKDE